MLRVLIAGSDMVLSKQLAFQLEKECAVQVCTDGNAALELLGTFDPDILFIDLQLPTTDGFTVIRTIRETGRKLPILAVSTFSDPITIARLEELRVNGLFVKPVNISNLVTTIRDIGFCLKYPDNVQRKPEDEVDNILFDLGFRMGPARYYYVRNAILVRCNLPEGSLMKSVYYEIAKQCGGNSPGAEKSVRDAIKAAWSRGNPHIWGLYFPPEQNGTPRCPSNDEFVTRIADCLMKEKRLKRPLLLDDKAI